MHISNIKDCTALQMKDDNEEFVAKNNKKRNSELNENYVDAKKMYDYY